MAPNRVDQGLVGQRSQEELQMRSRVVQVLTALGSVAAIGARWRGFSEGLLGITLVPLMGLTDGGNAAGCETPRWHAPLPAALHRRTRGQSAPSC